MLGLEDRWEVNNYARVKSITVEVVIQSCSHVSHDYLNKSCSAISTWSLSFERLTTTPFQHIIPFKNGTEHGISLFECLKKVNGIVHTTHCGVWQYYTRLPYDSCSCSRLCKCRRFGESYQFFSDLHFKLKGPIILKNFL